MKKIEVISTSGCGKCRILKQWLAMKELPYEDRNISYDEEAVQLLRDNGLKSLPQLRIDGQFIVYNEFNDILDLVKEWYSVRTNSIKER